ncbi:MAG: hypothetical protein WC699_07800 [Bacteroidales bacterium]|jgi:hypothetical protein
MKKYYKLGFLLAGILLLAVIVSGCAYKDPIDQMNGPHPYGFLSGLLHGFIAPFDFIGMLFSDRIVMYAPNNNGTWYAFGFLLGSGGWGFLGNKGASYRRRPKRDEYGSAEVL